MVEACSNWLLSSAVAVDQDTFASVPLSAESTAILSEEKDTKQADARMCIAALVRMGN